MSTRQTAAPTERVQISVPLTPAEHARLNQYLQMTGKKKGAVVRFAIVEYLNERGKE